MRWIATFCIAVTVVVQGGCVAMNIPSDQIFDRQDGGGIFGDWRDGTGRHPHSSQSMELDQTLAFENPKSFGRQDQMGGFDLASSTPCLGGTGDRQCFGADALPMGSSGFEHAGDRSAAPPAEVPWPRFHPIPTRPVFGPTNFN